MSTLGSLLTIGRKRTACVCCALQIASYDRGACLSVLVLFVAFIVRPLPFLLVRPLDVGTPGMTTKEPRYLRASRVNFEVYNLQLRFSAGGGNLLLIVCQRKVSNRSVCQ